MSEQQQQQAVAAAAQIINHGTPEQQQQMQNSNQLIGAAVIHSPNVVRVFFCIGFPLLVLKTYLKKILYI